MKLISKTKGHGSSVLMSNFKKPDGIWREARKRVWLCLNKHSRPCQLETECLARLETKHDWGNRGEDGEGTRNEFA